jgi:uncharacterized membrane protein (UPF0127 family)
MQMKNDRTEQVIASVVEIADTRATRRRGLLGRDALDPAVAMVITPCCSIHTAFMRFAIDAAFVDRNGRVTNVVHDLAPWRIAMALRAHAVIEFAGGCLRRRDVQVGDRLYLAPLGDDGGGLPLSGSGSSVSVRMTASKPACSGS